MELLCASLDNSSLHLVLTSNVTQPFTQIVCHLMQQLRPASPRLQSPSSHVPYNLPTCTHVFVRHDALRKPLQPPYDGPYKVLCRQDKHYTLEINGKWSTISLDRLKPACLEPHITPPPSITHTNTLPTPLHKAQPLHTTRSGRRVHFPDRYGTN